MNSPIIYTPNIFTHIDFDTIDRDIIWEQREAPRSEAYYASSKIPYTYGKGAGERTYIPHVLREHNTGQTIGALEHIWGTLGGYAAYELLFCNRYADQHQHLGWHADDSPAIDVTRPIVVITFGAEREIWFKTMTTGRNSAAIVRPNDGVEKLTLQHGSMLVMNPGMQQTHLHRIPKHSAPCGPRVSLTFRGLAPGFTSFEDIH